MVWWSSGRGGDVDPTQDGPVAVGLHGLQEELVRVGRQPVERDRELLELARHDRPARPGDFRHSFADRSTVGLDRFRGFEVSIVAVQPGTGWTITEAIG